MNFYIFIWLRTAYVVPSIDKHELCNDQRDDDRSGPFLRIHRDYWLIARVVFPVDTLSSILFCFDYMSADLNF